MAVNILHAESGAGMGNPTLRSWHSVGLIKQCAVGTTESYILEKNGEREIVRNRKNDILKVIIAHS